MLARARRRRRTPARSAGRRSGWNGPGWCPGRSTATSWRRPALPGPVPPAGTLDDAADADGSAAAGPRWSSNGHLAGARRAELAGSRAQLLGHARAGLVDLAEHRAARRRPSCGPASGHGVAPAGWHCGRSWRTAPPARCCPPWNGPGQRLCSSPRRRRWRASSCCGWSACRVREEGLTAARSEDGFEPVELLVGQGRPGNGGSAGPAGRDAVGGADAGHGAASQRLELAGRTLVEYAALDGDLVAVVVGALALEAAGAVRRGGAGGEAPAGSPCAGWPSARRPRCHAGARRHRGRGDRAAARAPAAELFGWLPANRWSSCRRRSPAAPWAHLCAALVSVAPSSASWLRTARRRVPPRRACCCCRPVLQPRPRRWRPWAGCTPAPGSWCRRTAPSTRWSGTSGVPGCAPGRPRAVPGGHPHLLLVPAPLPGANSTVHEIGLRVVLAPYRVVLSACDSGADTTLRPTSSSASSAHCSARAPRPRSKSARRSPARAVPCRSC